MEASPLSFQKGANHLKKKKKWAHIGFIAPGFLIYTIFMMIPLAFAFYYSVFDWNGIGPKTFVGLDNFIKLFTSTRISRTFFAALLNNFKMCIRDRLWGMEKVKISAVLSKNFTGFVQVKQRSICA